MHTTKRVALAVAVCCAIMSVSVPSHAEQGRSFFTLLYAGPQWTLPSDIEGQTTSLGREYTLESVDYQTDITVGAGLGYWHNRHWGVQVDAFTFRSAAEDQNAGLHVEGVGSGHTRLSDDNIDFKGMAVAFNILGRYPLGKSTFIYGGIGPALFMNKFVIHTTGADETATNFGFTVPFGIQHDFLDRDAFTLGAFAGGKFAYNMLEIEVGSSEINTTLFSPSLNVGVSMGFKI